MDRTPCYERGDRSSILLRSAICGISSAARTSALQAECRWFESIIPHHMEASNVIGNVPVLKIGHRANNSVWGFESLRFRFLEV